MKNIVILFLFIFLVKLSILFTPALNGLWSILNVIGFVSIIFMLYLLSQIKLEIPVKGVRNFSYFIIILLSFLTFFTWNSFNSLSSFQKDNLVAIKSANNDNLMKSAVYEKYLLILQTYHKQKDTKNKSLQSSFESLDLRNLQNAQLINSYFPDDYLEIRIAEIAKNEITVYGIDKSRIGKLEGYNNFGGGKGFVQYRAKLNLGGIEYEHQN